ncbi:hypothetical protein NM688_g959 [Phlebia brevispora]|uniref:Uncharacterized protein n=1 Tax=Phlebia brevispora TaxID=194682 RepID=A0ACC1TCJ9_9APHY|nr:hypothetical protein NM688_g959 [Phlebia brevispora]
MPWLGSRTPSFSGPGRASLPGSYLDTSDVDIAASTLPSCLHTTHDSCVSNVNSEVALSHFTRAKPGGVLVTSNARAMLQIDISYFSVVSIDAAPHRPLEAYRAPLPRYLGIDSSALEPAMHIASDRAWRSHNSLIAWQKQKQTQKGTNTTSTTSNASYLTMAPIRVGFIGLSTQGWAAFSLVNPLFDPLLSKSYTLTALCTTKEASAKATAAHYTPLAGRTVKAYFGEEGIHAIANDPEVDLVAVSVRVAAHYKAVLPAIEAGKDVFIEWPVGNGYKEALEIAEAAKRKGVRALVGAQSIQLPYLRKVKEILESGKIGRVISTTALLSTPTDPEFLFWSRKADASTAQALDIKNGITILDIPVGHFLTALTYVLGDFTEVSATGAIQYPTAELVDADGKPTGQTLEKTVHDQIAISGVLQSKGSQPGTFVNIHCRGAIPLTGEYAHGRTAFKWIIDGELGTIEVQGRPGDDGLSALSNTEKRVLLNGEEVQSDTVDADRLGGSGRAWVEFAKGKDGEYWGLEESVRVHRVLDAALTSIQEGKRLSLV